MEGFRDWIRRSRHLYSNAVHGMRRETYNNEVITQGSANENSSFSDRAICCICQASTHGPGILDCKNFNVVMLEVLNAFLVLALMVRSAPTLNWMLYGRVFGKSCLSPAVNSKFKFTNGWLILSRVGIRTLYSALYCTSLNLQLNEFKVLLIIISSY